MLSNLAALDAPVTGMPRCQFPAETANQDESESPPKHAHRGTVMGGCRSKVRAQGKGSRTNRCGVWTVDRKTARRFAPKRGSSETSSPRANLTRNACWTRSSRKELLQRRRNGCAPKSPPTTE